MYLLKSLEGSEITKYDFGSVTVADVNFRGVDHATLTVPTICFYPYEASYSREIWAGKAELRKHWSRGSVGFMPAGSDISSTPEHPYREVAMQFNSELFAQAIGAEVDPSKIDFRFADVTSHATTGLASVLMNLAVSGGAENVSMLVETVTLALAISIIKQFSAAADVAVRWQDDLSDVRRARVFEYIDANLHKRISLMELAEVAHVSQFYFSRQFHRKIGMSPMRFIMQRRVERAKVDLLRPDATIAGVAYDCGFGGQSHFSTTFKTFTGISPGEYRRAGGLLLPTAA